MRVGFIAMSGVRAENPKLVEAGLTMPGVVERGRVVASLPSLSLLTLAALTPPAVEVEYHEVRDLRENPTLPTDCDLIAISSLSAQILDAYALARRFKAAGATVVMGGLHVTALPEEALEHCDAVVIGEGEPLWPRLVQDFRAGRLRRRYKALPGEDFDLADAPIPRFDLLDIDKYNRLTVQTSRGCPHKCEFCASSVLLTNRYKLKPVDNIIAEIHAIRRVWKRPFIELADDNSFVHRAHARQLLEALTHERINWFTETDISIANDPNLLTLMREAGCRQVLIGLESPRAEGLRGIETRADWKLRQLDRYEHAVRTIQSHGITVNGCFILGLDGDDESVFDAVYDFVTRTNLYDVQITVQTPFPGTPLYDRLLAEGRILRPGAWSACTLLDVNFVPRHMTPDRLQWGLVELARRLYDPGFVRERHDAFFREMHRRHISPPMPHPVAS
ncbi:MAG: B12-binding domain-containing radical SAM protein [Phycisphaerales bacterium]|nr:B12-binding domain-containing radical SAM protein [Phycisphaerales bacterium]